MFLFFELKHSTFLLLLLLLSTCIVHVEHRNEKDERREEEEEDHEPPPPPPPPLPEVFDHEPPPAPEGVPEASVVLPHTDARDDRDLVHAALDSDGLWAGRQTVSECVPHSYAFSKCVHVTIHMY